jgi:hypothetical protein
MQLVKCTDPKIKHETMIGGMIPIGIWLYRILSKFVWIRSRLFVTDFNVLILRLIRNY